MWRIERVWARELIVFLLVSIVATMGILGFTQMARISDVLATQTSSFWDVCRLILYALPSMVAFCIPVAMLFSTVWVGTRWAMDNEWLAWESLGVSGLRVLSVTFLISLAMSALVFWCTSTLEPLGIRRLKQELEDYVISQATRHFVPRKMVGEIPNMALYAMGQTGDKLRHVYAIDSRDPNNSVFHFMDSAQISGTRKARAIYMLAENGISVNLGKSHILKSFVSFEKADLILRIYKQSKKRFDFIEDFRGLTTQELQQQRRDPAIREAVRLRSGVALHRRYVMAVAPILFALFAVVLVQTRGIGRSWVIMLSVIVLIGFYFSMRFGDHAGQSGKIPIWVAGWVPVLVPILLLILVMSVMRAVRR